MSEEPKKRGRPRKEGDEKTTAVLYRLTVEQRKKVDAFVKSLKSKTG